MSYTALLHSLKGSSSSGNFGHSGRPGKVGGSAPNPIGLPGGLVPNLPAGTYNAVYSTVFNKQTAINRASKLGPGHVVVRVGGQYHVIDTGDPTQATGQPIYYSTATGAKIAAGVTAYWQGQTGQPAAAPATAAPPKVYGSKVEELYDKASPEAQQFANKYGLLAQDDKALTYLKEMSVADYNSNRPAIMSRAEMYSANNQQYRNRQTMNAAVDGLVHKYIHTANTVKQDQSNPGNYELRRLIDPLGRGDDGYAVVDKKFQPKDLPKVDPNKPDFTTMASLKSQSAKEVAAHQAHMDKNWNTYDNGQIKAKVKNAFEVTMPQPLHDEYADKKNARDNTKFLYHGTDVNGATGIVKAGFFVGDTPKIGRMYGNGIYLADQESKSVQYAHSGSGSKLDKSRGVVLITQASMGKQVKSDDDYAGSGGWGEDLKPGVDTFTKTANSSYGYDPYKSQTYSTEYIVRDPGAVQPRTWLDIERSRR